jgi:hypothetical protein
MFNLFRKNKEDIKIDNGQIDDNLENYQIQLRN